MRLRLSPDRCAIVVVVDSQKRDRVVGELVRGLKEAAKQFSRRRPGLLVVQFLEIDPQGMLVLAQHDSHDPSKASALQLATNILLQGPERLHVHTVVYRSHGTLIANEVERGVQEQGYTYSFVNPAHPEAGDLRYRPFPIRTA